MKLILTCWIMVLSLLVIGCNDKAIAIDKKSDVEQSHKVTDINNDELQKMLDQGVVLVDIRLPEEWASTGVIKGSKKVTFFSATGRVNPNLQNELSAFASKDKPIILICRTGSRTRYGSQMLTEMGYKKVYNVTHGITQWLKENRPTVK